MCHFTCRSCRATINQRETANHECAPRNENDDFTTAAADEARLLDDRYDLEWESPHQVFVRGAEWARDHLARQEPTDAEKGAAMDALGCELRVVENGQTACDLHGGYATADDVCEVVEVALSGARAALTAAKEARA